MRYKEFRLDEIKKGQKDSNGFTKCWPGYHAAGTKKGKNGGRVRNCVANEGLADTIVSAGSSARQAFDRAVASIPRPFDEKEVAKDIGAANQPTNWVQQQRNNIDVPRIRTLARDLLAKGYTEQQAYDAMIKQGIPARLAQQALQLPMDEVSDELADAVKLRRVQDYVRSGEEPFKNPKEPKPNWDKYSKNTQLNFQRSQRKQVQEMPAWLRNDPEGHTIIPHGGMGSGNEDTWRKISIRKLHQIIQNLESGNYTAAEYSLYKNGYLEGAIRALARYDEFRVKQGRRKLGRGREVELG